MEALPTISILIPAKNAAETIHIAIEDAMHQEGVDWQILIANDGSTDDTVKTVKEYQEFTDKIILVEVDQPGGIVAGRNLLISMVDTTYLAWLDADDGWPRKDKLSRQIKFLETNKDHAMVGDGKVSGVYLENLRQRNFRFPIANKDIQTRLLFKNSFIMSSIVARTEMVKHIVFDKEWEYLEDYVWVQQIANKFNVANSVLGATLHFISTSSQQQGKDEMYEVYQKEANLLLNSLTSNGVYIDRKDAEVLAFFVRRNKKLNGSQSQHLKQLIKDISGQLVTNGFSKSNVKGFFYDINLRRLRCRWLMW
jgi:glycosyltransferase involved in cell wall biosynthesis